MAKEKDTSTRTSKGIKLCAEFLSKCLSFGWGKESLAGLEKVWWQHHDRNGNLIR